MLGKSLSEGRNIGLYNKGRKKKMERDDLIRKLKTVKNPRERDKLSGHLPGRKRTPLKKSRRRRSRARLVQLPFRRRCRDFPNFP